MKKYVFVYYGFGEPTREVMDAWSNWFASVADKMVDSGNPFGPGREVTNSGSRDLPFGPESTTGYTIVEVDTIDDAEKLLANCPIITSVHIYEAMSM